MAWLPEVQALEVGISRPFKPKKMARLAAVVCGIMRMYVLAEKPSEWPYMISWARSQISRGEPVEEPLATPMRPSQMAGSSSNPASSSARSPASTHICETGPKLRSCLRVQCAGGW